MSRDSGLNDPSLVLDYLNRNGLTIRAAGYFDFDGDEINEKWFSAEPQPAGKLEF